MEHPPPNHDVGRVMASCTLRTHLKGCLSVNLVVLVVLLLLDGENFLFLEEDVFVSVLGMPLGGDALLLSVRFPSKQE
jgi:hypothetical protein